MTVAKKMIFLVLSAVLGILILSGMGTYQTSKVYEAANYGNVNTVPSVLVIDEAFSAMAALRTQVWQHVAQKDPVIMGEIEQKILNNRKKVDEALKKYEPLLSDDKDRALLAADRSIMAEYDALRDKVLALSRANKNEEARELMMANQQMMARMWDAFEDHRQYNADLGRKAAEDAVATKQGAMLFSVTLSILTLIAVGVIGFFTTRSLLKQLGGEPDYAKGVMTRISEGDLTVSVQTKAGDSDSLLYVLKAMVERLSSIIGEVRSTADSLTSASEEVSATAQSLSQSASEQAASVEETSASMEEMSASVAQNTENAKLTDSMAAQAAKEAVEGGEAVRQTVSAMKSIAEKIGIIDDIAYQTNLLALNAAIEAARAGGAWQRLRRGRRRGAQAGRTFPGGRSGNLRNRQGLRGTG